MPKQPQNSELEHSDTELELSHKHCNAGQSHRLKISGYPKIDTIHKIDDFGGSRKNTQKIQKIYKIEDSGGTQKNTKNIQPETASGVKKYQKYRPEPIFCLFLKQIWTQKRAAAEGRRPLLGAAEGRDHIWSKSN
jgi:hypothetical protein